MKKVFIYSLNCPTTNEIRYVGKTIQPLKQRLKCHLNPNKNDNTYRANWINSLKKVGLKPIITLLEECTEENWVERECYWIDYYSNNNLTNATKGGNGGHIVKISTKEKYSLNLKERWKNEEYRNKMSEISKENWKNEEYINTASNRMKLKWENEEYRNKMSEMSKQLWKNEVYRKTRLSDDAKEKISIKNTGKKHNETTKKIMSEKHIKNWETNKDTLISKRKHLFKAVIINNIEYPSINEAARVLNINSGTLYRKIKSIKYPNFNYLQDNTNMQF